MEGQEWIKEFELSQASAICLPSGDFRRSGVLLAANRRRLVQIRFSSRSLERPAQLSRRACCHSAVRSHFEFYCRVSGHQIGVGWPGAIVISNGRCAVQSARGCWNTKRQCRAGRVDRRGRAGILSCRRWNAEIGWLGRRRSSSKQFCD